MTAAAAVGRAAVQRRVTLVLMCSVIPTSGALAASFAATAVLAEEITGSETLAALAAGSMSVGNVAAAVPLARLMARRGRRPGLVTGWSIAAGGMLLVFASALVELYPLLVAGTVTMGAGQAANLSTRYAAADLADEEQRGRAIGMLMWATTFGAIAGPSIALGPAGAVGRTLRLPELSVPFLMALIMFGAGLATTHLKLRPDPLEMLGKMRPASSMALATPLTKVARRIAARPAARLAVIAMLTGQAVMVGVMTMTPLHIKNGGHELRMIGFVISLHIVGMYAFSPAVGWLVDRIGPHLMIGAGGVTLFAGAEMASRTDPADSLGLFVGLLLIGLGWSFGLISGSSLLTGAFPSHQRVEVQGAADMIMAIGGAAAALLAGVVMERVGYNSFSHWAGLAALLLVAAAAAAWLTANRPGSAKPSPA